MLSYFGLMSKNIFTLRRFYCSMVLDSPIYRVLVRISIVFFGKWTASLLGLFFRDIIGTLNW